MAKLKQEMREFTKEERARLVEFFDILIEIDQEEKRRQKRLIKEPKGFIMDGIGRTCSLCRQTSYEKVDGWYDKWGYKCANCQDAVNKQIIPGSLCKDSKHEKYVTDSELSSCFGIHIQTIRKLIRQGKINARRVPGGPYLILRKDNPGIQKVIEKERAEKQ